MLPAPVGHLFYWIKNNRMMCYKHLYFMFNGLLYYFR